VITSATINGPQITIAGTYNSVANTFYRLEFFANAVNDGSGHGEGERYLGFVNVATDGSGNATFNTVLTATVAVGEFISATATQSDGSYSSFTVTSEFAFSRAATGSNNAPVLDNSGSMTLTTINEDQTANGGNTVSSIITSAGGDRITDVDSGAVEGIAITTLVGGNGTWEFSINGGSSWNAIGAVSNSSALLLRDTDLVRFVPNTLTGTTGSFDFRAWDQTLGTFGTKIDVSTNGGGTAFSSAVETAGITVTDVNDEQVLGTNTGTTVLEGSVGNVITTAMLQTTDVDNTSAQLVYSVTGVPANGVLRRSGIDLLVSSTFTQADIDAGIITYTHDDSETTSDSFSFTVDDGAGSVTAGTFFLTITPVNDNSITAIIDNNGAADFVIENVSVGTVVGITAFADDLDASDTISYSLDDNAGGLFAINPLTGLVTVAGSIDREAAASYNITVRATSTDTSSTTRIFTIAVGDVNEFAVGPVSDTNGAANSVAENAANGTVVGITAFAQDLDATNNTITYTLDDNAGGRFAIDGVTGVVTVLDGTLLDRETAASHNITVRATSSDGSSATQLYVINVSDVDEFPVGPVSDTNGAANSVAENAASGTLVDITASAVDADATNNTISWSLFDNDGGRFQIDSNTGVVTVLGPVDRETDGPTRNITVRATSADGSFSDQSFTINILDVNEFAVSPVVDGDGTVDGVNENAPGGSVVGISAQAFDSDSTNNYVTWSLTDDAGGRFAIDVNTGLITTTGPLDHEAVASHSVTVRALSQDGSVSFRTFNIAVNDLNESPAGSDLTVSTPEDTLLVLTVANFGFSDPDGGDFLGDVRIDLLPATGQLMVNGSPAFAGQVVSAVDIAAGNMVWQPPSDGYGAGLATIGFTVADSAGLFAAAGKSLTLDVVSVNDNPLANNGTYWINEDSGLSGSVSGTDIDSLLPGWNYTLVTGPSNASGFVLNPDGSFTYQPAADYTGTDSFVFRMHDGQGGTSDATVTINIAPVNDAPMSFADLFAVFQGTTLTETLGVLANDFDTDNDPLIAVLLTPPASGTLTFNANGTFVYTPNLGFIGVDHFVYLASDGQSSGTPVQVTINVNIGTNGSTGTGTGGGGTSEDLDPEKDYPFDDPLPDEQDSLKNLIARLARKGNGADALADVIDLTGLMSRQAIALQLESTERLNSRAEFDLMEQLASAFEKYGLTDANLELEVNPGGPRLVFSMEGIWASLVAAQKEATESSQLFTVSPLAFGAGTVTFAAAITYLLWYLRGGVLMATLLSQLPTWRLIDPLPILESARSKNRDTGDDMQSYFG